MAICQVLGAVSVDGAPLSSTRQRRVLAALAISRGDVVSADRLVDIVWDGEPPDTTNALQTYVSRLRSVLGPDSIVWRPPGYALALPVDAVDAWKFEALVDQARHRPPIEAITLLDDALALWRGPAYAEFADSEFARAEAVRLQELRAAAAVARLDTLLALGRPDDAAAEAVRLIETDPYRESVWERRMRALHATGRTVDAVRVFHDYRTLLANETGLEPSPELAALEQTILTTPPERRAKPTRTRSAVRASTDEGSVAVRALLLTDIERSTMLLQRLGPRYQSLLVRHHDIVLAAAVEVGGEVETDAGDGFLLTFATPSDAVEAAVAAQRALAVEEWPENNAVRVRMAVHAGEVATTAAGLVGLSIHHTARIASAAHGGQILISEAARALSPHFPEHIALRNLGEHDIRDVGPVVLHQVLHPDLPHSFAPLRRAGGSANNLPAPLSSLIGRTNEISAATRLLTQHRLVTLTGPGGSGKTRLGLAVASQCAGTFPDGTWFIELAALTSGSEVAPAVGAALRMGEATGEVALLVDAFADRTALLVLDNCEHLLDAVALLSTRLLTSCPNLKILATSRELLRVPGEALFQVPGLDVPPPGSDRDRLESCEAVQLFSARATLVKPGYEQHGEIDAVVDICRQVDGLPLAVELAAARLRTLSAPEIAHRLGGALRLLSGGGRVSLPRHQTLEATIDWSFQLLTPPEQQLLVRLAVFAGGADLDAVAAVCGDDHDATDVLDHITSLQDKSLVSVVDACGRANVRLLETVRQYADSRFSQSAEAEVVRRRHADWYLGVAQAIRRGPADGDFDHWVCRLHDDVANLLAATWWYLGHEPRSALELLVALGPAFDLFERDEPTWTPLLVQALGDADESQTAAHFVALAWLAWDAVEGAITLDAEAAQKQASAAVGRIDDPDALAEILVMTVHNRHSLPPGPAGSAEVAAAIMAADRTERFLPRYWARAMIASVVPPDLGRPLVEQAAAIADSHAHPRLAARARAHLATVAAWSGRSREARTLATSALGTLISDTTVERADLYLLVLVEAEHGSVEVALALAEDLSARGRERPHSGVHAAGTLAALAHVRRLAGDDEGALDAAERAARVLRWPHGFIDVLNCGTLSAIYRSRGRLGEAAAVLPASTELFGLQGATDGPIRAIESWAGLARALEYRPEAADLLATARAKRDEQHKPPSPIVRRELDALTSEIGEHLGHPLDTPALESVISDLAAAARQWPTTTAASTAEGQQLE